VGQNWTPMVGQYSMPVDNFSTTHAETGKKIDGKTLF
jgi:hypothetical protein